MNDTAEAVAYDLNDGIVVEFATFSMGLHKNGRLVVDRLIFPPDKLREIADQCDPNNDWGDDLTNILRDIEGKFSELDDILAKGYGLETFYIPQRTVRPSKGDRDSEAV